MRKTFAGGFLSFSALCLVVCMGLAAGAQNAETPRVTGAASALSVVRWTGSLPEAAGRTVEMSFALYEEPAGGLALWQETQPVKVAADGRYTVLLGAMNAEGLPQTLFQGGAARWIEARVAGETSAKPAPRSLLAAVPYAFKSLDAETLAGRPAADYLTREDMQTAVAAAQAATEIHTDATLTGAGTTGYVPLWTGPSALGNSPIVVSGSNVGIGTTAPVYPLDVNGTATLRGGLKLEPGSAASPTAGSNSSTIEFQNSTYSTASNSAVPQYFVWQSQSTGNDTASASAELALLTSFGDATPKATGFSFGPTGLLSFAPGQAFPGTIAGVTAGTGLMGGGSSGAVNLAVDTTVIPQLSASNTFTGSANTFANGVSFKKAVTFAAGQSFPGTGTVTGITAGTGLKGGGASGAVTLSVDATKVPLLAAANTFTGNQTITGNATVSGSVNALTVSAQALYTVNKIQAGGDILGMGQIDGTGLMAVSPPGSATASAGGFSLMGPSAIAYNSATKGQVQDSFFWGAYPVGNNTPSPTAELNLYFQTATASTNTGLSINDKGIVTFAGGQTFPGSQVTGNESVTGTFNAAGGTFTGPVSASTTSGGSAALVGSGKTSGQGLYASSDTGIAAYAVSYSPAEGSTGVFGLGGNPSKIQPSVAASQVAGVWGDAGNPSSGYAAGVIGTADNADGGSFFNNSKAYATVYASNSASGGVTGLFRTLMASTPTGTCGIGGDGDLSCTGRVKALVSAGGGRKVETYSVQSAESWMEDFGTGQLQRGAAVVTIDPAFAETVSESADYHVFLTPRGDSKGLYVTNATATAFEVRESGGGVSSLAFDYRIVAKRRGFEAERLTDVTETFNAAMKAANRPAHPGSGPESTAQPPARP
jgi:hypothetical protein